MQEASWFFTGALAVIALGAGAVIGAGGMRLALGRNRRRMPPGVEFTAEDCLGFARRHGDEMQWGRALEWAQRARKLMPENVQTWRMEALALAQLGDFDGAADAYISASMLSPDGENYSLVARALLQAGRSEAEVANWVARAMRASPNLTIQIADDPLFSAVVRRPEIAPMVERAFVRDAA